MAFNKIRGSQIRSGAITGDHIQNQAIAADHLAKSAIQAVLESKLVVDYVQLATPAEVTVTGSSLDVAITGAPVVDTDLEGLGVLLGKRVIVRNALTGETFYNPDHKHEVFGRLTHDGSKYTLELGCYEQNGSFTAFEVEAGTKIDVQYAQRFTLFDVDETFAANEKFVDGAVDVTTAIKIKDLQTKIEALGTSSSNDLKDVKDALQGQIDALVSAIGTETVPERQATQDDVNNGLAANVGDIIPEVPATGIKKVLEDHAAAIKALEDRATDLEGRATAVEDRATAVEGRATDLEDRATALEGRADGVDAIIGVNSDDAQGIVGTGIRKDIEDLVKKDASIDEEIQKLKDADAAASAKLASNKKYVVEITSAMDKEHIMLPADMYFEKIDGTNGVFDDVLYVYVNGMLQAEDINFTQIEDVNHPGFCNGVEFGGDQLAETDVVIIKWVNVTVTP